MLELHLVPNLPSTEPKTTTVIIMIIIVMIIMTIIMIMLMTIMIDNHNKTILGVGGAPGGDRGAANARAGARSAASFVAYSPSTHSPSSHFDMFECHLIKGVLFSGQAAHRGAIEGWQTRVLELHLAPILSNTKFLLYYTHK